MSSVDYNKTPAEHISDLLDDLSEVDEKIADRIKKGEQFAFGNPLFATRASIIASLPNIISIHEAREIYGAASDAAYQHIQEEFEEKTAAIEDKYHTKEEALKTLLYKVTESSLKDPVELVKKYIDESCNRIQELEARVETLEGRLKARKPIQEVKASLLDQLKDRCSDEAYQQIEDALSII